MLGSSQVCLDLKIATGSESRRNDYCDFIMDK